MRILVTGKGGCAGSWLVRGCQLGQALGADVQAMSASIQEYDAIVVVKRTPSELMDRIRASKKRWIYDIVDAFPQPAASNWSADQSIDWAQRHIHSLRPDAVIWPTQRMRADCAVDIRGIVLPHHHRPGIERNPIRGKVQTIGYEGDARFLAGWQRVLERQCSARDIRFVVNPDRLADVDICVAFRDRQWSGYAQRHWKSNVKLANAHASGTPFIGQPESGYLETASGAEYWADSERELDMAIDWLEDQSTREMVSDRFVKSAYPVQRAAQNLKAFLHAL